MDLVVMRGLIRIKVFLFVGPSLARRLGSLVKFDKDLVVMGGKKDFIYKLECVNGQYQWQLMNARLKTIRFSFVAAMIPTIFGNLY